MSTTNTTPSFLLPAVHTGGVIPVGGSIDYASSVLQQADGKLVLAGYSINGSYFDYSLVRLNADGSLDTSFGSGGTTLIAVGSSTDTAYSVIQQADGKLVLAGYSHAGNTHDYCLMRLNTDGSLDTSFGSGGQAIFPVGSSDNAAYSVVQQADGKLVLTGSSANDYSLIRLNADGSLDTSFGTVTSGNANTLNAAPSYTENAAPLVLDSSVIITDTDLAALDGGAGNYAGASVTLARAGGASAQDVFSASGSLTFSGSDAILSGTTVGSVSNSGGTLTITFNSAATQAAVNAVLSAIAYSNTSDAPPASVQIDWSFSDGNTGSQGTGGAGTTSGTTIVNITAVNDAPVIIDVPASAQRVAAGTAADLADFTVADADGADVNLTVTLTTTNGTLSGLTDTDSNTAGIQLTGTAAQINATIASATFTASAAGAASIDISVSDGLGSPTTASYSLTAQINTTPSFFINGGKAIIPVGTVSDEARSVIQQTDGKLVLAGYSTNGSYTDYSAVRLNTDGSLDTSFGSNGKALIPVGSSTDQAYSVIQQTDGKLVLAGYSTNGSYTDYSAVRLNTDGSLDTSFGSNGKALIPVGSSTDQAYSVIQQTDGKLVLAGYSTNGGYTDYSAVRLNTDGSLDTSFGSNGKALIPVGSSTDQAYSVIQQTDGKLVLAGYSTNGGYTDYSVVRLNADGSLDSNFGTDGKVITPVGTSSDIAYSVIQQADGKLVLAGYSNNGGNYDYSMVRLNADGSLDTSFGTGGKALIPVGTAYDQAYSVIQQADGKLILAGYSTNGSYTDYSVVRLNADGSLDSNFGTGGKVITPVGTSSDTAYSVIQQADGKLVLTGYSTNGSYTDYSVVRLNADGSLDTSFNPTNTLNGVVTHTEGAAPVVLDASVVLTDVDLAMLNGGAGDYGGSSLTLARMGGAVADDVFSGSGTLSLSAGVASLSGTPIASYTQSGGTLVLTFASGTTQAQLNAALSSLAYSNTSDAPPASVQIGWNFNDGNTGAQGPGGALNTSGSTTVNITGVNDAPVIAGISSAIQNVTVGQAAELADFTVSDPDGANTNLTVTLTTTNGTLGGLTDADTNTAGIQLVGTAAQINTALAGATFTATTPGLASIGVSLIDGVAAPVTATYYLADPANTAPTFLATGSNTTSTLGGSVAYTEGAAAPVVLDASVVLTDVDLAMLNGGAGDYGGSSLTLARMGGAVADDVFSGSGTLSLSAGVASLSGTPIASYTQSGGTLVLTFASGTTQAQLNAALSSLAYSNTSDAPPASVQIGWNFNDGNTGAQGPGGALNTSGSTTVNITGVNDAPVIAGISSAIQNVTVGQAAELADFTVSDPDGANTNLTVTLTTTNGTLGGLTDADTNTAGIQLVGTAAQINAALAGATFTATTPGLASIGVRLIDGIADPVTATYQLTDSGNTAPTFLTANGKAIIPVSSADDKAYSAVRQADGKLVLAGYSVTSSGTSYSYPDFSAIRLNIDGSVDTSFGTGGKIIIPVGSYDDQVQCVIQQADGKLVLAGYSDGGTYDDFSVVRLNADGSLDTNFGTGGKVTIAVGSYIDQAYSVIQQADGKLVLAGYSTNGSTDDYSVVRLNADGSLDTSFGTGGKLFVPVGSSHDYAYSVIQQADGRLVLAGYSTNGGSYDFSLVRLNTNGSLDTSFGTGGKALIPVGTAYDQAYSVIQQADGKLVLAGYSVTNGNRDYSVVRLNADGSLDTGFGTGGKILIPVGSSHDSAYSVIQQSDGKLVLAGVSNNGGSDDFSVVRLNADGSLDTSFGTAGKAIIPVDSYTDQAWSVIQQPDGKLVLTGTSYNGSNYDYSVVRLNDNGSLDTSFNANTMNGIAASYEGSTTMLDTSVVLADANLTALNNGLGDYGGTSLTLARAGGAVSEDVFSGGGSLILSAGVASVSGTAIASYTQSAGTLVLTFASGTTEAQLNAALSSIAYTNTSDTPPASVQIGWIFSDGNTGAQGTGGAATASGSTTVNITATNDAPVIAGIHAGIQSVTAGQATELADFTVSDPDGADANLSVTLTTTHGTLNGLTDADANTAGIQLTGTAAQINTALAGATFTATAPGLASIGIRASDSVATSATATYYLSDPANTAPTFVANGKVSIPVGSSYDQAYSVIQQVDGKLVLAGTSNDDYSVVRLNANGSLDTNFGTGGKALIPVGTSTDQAWSVIQQADGKLVLAGYSTNGSTDDYSVVRLNADGSLDTGFGSNGKILIPVGSYKDQARSLIQQTDGKLVLAGYSSSSNSYGNSSNDFSVVRLNADGSLDTGFGSTGKAVISVGLANEAYSVVQQTDGKLVLAGYSTSSISSNDDYYVMRLNTDGSLDTSFGASGKAIIPVGNSADQARSVIQQVDGKLVLAGYSVAATGYSDLSIVRLNANGSLDSSFGTGGLATIPVGTFSDIAYSVIQQADGKLVLAGYSTNGSNYDYSVVRLNVDGSLDTSFGTGGKALIPVGTAYDQAYSVIQQADGKLVLAGYSNNGGNYDYSVVRLNADGSLDTSFNADTLNGLTTYTEGAATPVVLDNDVVLTDIDLARLNNGAGDYGGSSLTLTRVGGAMADDVFSGSGTLSLSAGVASLSGTAIASYTQNGGTLVLTFASGTTQAQLNAALSLLAYSNTSDAPPASIQIGWTFSDGNTGAQGQDGAATTSGTTTVSITGVNDAPVISGIPASIQNITAGQAAELADFTVADADGPNANLTVTLTTTNGTLGGLVDADANTAGIQLTGTAAQINAALAGATFTAAFNSTTPGVASIGISVSDGVATPTTGTYRLTDPTNTTPTFLTNGKVTIPLGTSIDFAYSVIQQIDGKLVLAGYSYNGGTTSIYSDYSVVRLNADGSLDTSFGNSGKAIIPVGTSADQAYSMVQQADGKLVLAGFSTSGTYSSFSMVRLNADGNLDTSFGTGGKAIIPVGSYASVAYSVIQQADGKLVLAGIGANTYYNYGVVRLNTDGSLDTDFGTGGKAIIPVGSATAEAKSVIQQADGKLVLAGYSTNGSYADYSVVRLNVDGSLDTSFDTDGKAIIPVGSFEDQAYSVIQQADGKLVLAGLSNSSSSTSNTSTLDYSVVRLNVDGSLDTSFGSGGKKIIPVGTSADVAYSVIQQADGKLVLAGYRYNGTSDGYSDYEVVRLNTDGSLDTSFGTGGKAIIAVGSGYDIAYSVIQQADGKLVLAGYSDADFSMVRLNTDGSLDTSFNPNTLNGLTVYTEGAATPVALDNDVVLTDADLAILNNESGDYGGATLTLERVGGAVADDVFSGSTRASSVSLVLSEGVASFSGTTIDSFTPSGLLVRTFTNFTAIATYTQSAGTLVLTFASGTTQAQLNGALSLLAYSNTSDAPPASVQISWTFSDGNTGAQGPDGALNTSGTTTVNITAVNDAPVIIDVPASVQSVTVGTASALADFTVADADGADVNLTVTLTTTNGTLSNLTDADTSTAGTQLTGTAAQINTTIANATFTASTAGAASIKISVSDGVANPTTTTSYSLSATLPPANTAPSFLLPAVHVGQSIIPVGSSTDMARSTIQQADGKLVLGGLSNDSNHSGDYSLVRLNADGSLDISFGTGGKAIIPVSNDNNAAYSIIQQADGKLVLAGYSINGSYFDYSLVRLNADGSLDTSFGSGGTTLIAVGSSTDTAYSVIQQADGKLVLAGYSHAGNTHDYCLMRLNTDGSLDTSFGSGGQAIFPVGSSDNAAYSVVQQADGKLVLTGSSANDYSLIRLNADGSLDTSFGTVTSGNANTLNAAPSYTENAAPLVLDSSVIITDTDLAALDGGAGNYAGASVTLARAGGASAQDVFSASGSLTFSGSDAILSGTTVGSVSNSGGTLTITFNSAATQAAVNAVLSAIAYSNTSDAPPASVQIDWSFSDGNTGSQGTGGAGTTSGTTIVNITAVNDVPTGTVTLSGTPAQGETLNADTSTLADADGLGTLSYQWLADGVAISGATATTYTLTLSEAGKSITVHVSYTDAEGTQESVVSAAVDVSHVFTGTPDPDSITGTGLNDTIYGLDRDDSLSAGAGDDLLDGGDGNDTLDGGAGLDTASYANASSAVNVLLYSTAAPQTTGGAGSDTLLNIENLTGSAYNDSLKGSNANNVLIGGLGNDSLDGWSGSDTMEGGSGNDTYYVNIAGDVVIETNADSVTGGVDTVYTMLSNYTLGANVENGVLYTSSALNLTGNSLNNMLTGNAGNNIIDGGSGSDTLDGGAGSDTMDGGNDNDTYYVNIAGDVVIETNADSVTGGVDTVYTMLSDYTLSANVENGTLYTTALNITGNSSNNVLTGNASNNIIDGGAGNDTLDGGAGLDTASYANASSAVNVLLYSTSAPQASGGAGSDTLINIENLTGSAYNDSLKGSNANNVLIGGLGNDSLDGWSGSDTMEGGDGNDTYYVNIAGDVVIETNADSVTGGVDTVYTMLSNYTLGANVENGVLYTSSAVNLTGNSLNNVLTGNTSNNVMDGGDGNDTMLGGNGNDTYYINVAGDVVIETNADSVTGGVDTVYTMLSDYTLGTNIENGVLYTSSTLNLTGNSLYNVLTGNANNNVISGGNGNDTLDGGDGNDTLDGGAGLDTASYANASSAVNVLLYSTAAPQTTGGAGSDTLINIENLTGSAYNDSLKGSTANNVLIGGLGNDSLDGWSGSDTMEGGDGNDTYYVNIAGDVVIETNADSVTGGVDTVYTMLSNYTLGANVENGVLYTSSALNLTGNSLNNMLTGNAGNNIIDGGSGSDTLDGGAGSDTMDGGNDNDTYYVNIAGDVVIETNADSVTGGVDTVYTMLSDYTLSANVENGTLYTTALNITGNSSNNVLTGNASNNIIDGGAGNDTLDGGAGLDTASYANASSAVNVLLYSTSAPQASGGAGSDTLINIENLTGSAYNDSLKGSNANNVLIGGLGNDSLDGWSGSDTMEGGDGNDTYYVNIAGDVVIETNADSVTGGVDTVYTMLSNYTLGANVENGTLYTSSAVNLTGNSLNNVLTGNAGNNVIDSGDGNDTLLGGAGQDTLTGGSGNDVFDFNALSELGLGSATRDLITDFIAGQDRIDLSTIDANISLGGDQAFSWVSSFTATAGQVRYADGIVYLNTDDDADAEYEIELTGSVPASLSAANFIL